MVFVKIILFLFLIWLLLEILIRLIAEKGLETDFYGSISRSEVQRLQKRFGLQVAKGNNWIHLGWIADPENERYRIQKHTQDANWETLTEVKYGSWLSEEESGRFRVLAISRVNDDQMIIGETDHAETHKPTGRQYPEKPVISSDWQYLFQPTLAGTYMNDHCLFRDKYGNWRIIGITSHSRGNYQREHKFAIGVGSAFPPKGKYLEDTPTCDNGDLAWAPHVIHDGEKYHLFWSPHELFHTTSKDGVTWDQTVVLMEKPFHKFFRDAMIVQVAPGQWLLYATGRGKWFSRVDIYQSFDLTHWQYIRPALTCGWGSEKNFVSGSMESPFLIEKDDHYYLSITYNNESFFLGALLLQFKVFLNRRAYNNTLVFHAKTPYAFGVYRGKNSTPGLISQLECHAPVYIRKENDWYITTCGWPFAATLTNGEVAFALLEWQQMNGGRESVNKR